MKSWWDLKPEDFPPGEPVLKSKRGLWYRDNNSGYTEHLADAGLYERDAAIKYCFDDKGKNGYCDVFAVPARMAVDMYSTADLQKKIDNLKTLQQYAEKTDKQKFVVF